MEEIDTLAEAVVREAKVQRITLATAESLTAGLISAAIADVPGASSVLKGGVVSYALEVKHDVLGVRGIDETNVVSADCAKQMAAGVQRLLNTKIAVSATGVAGPTGGTEAAPVGTVFIGCASGDMVFAEEHHFMGERPDVRRQTVQQALKMIWNCMKGGYQYGGKEEH